MANELKLVSFIYPGCIIVCNGSAKFRNGELPEIARIYHDRTVSWERKRISDQMREYVKSIVETPFVETYYKSGQNFFEN